MSETSREKVEKFTIAYNPNKDNNQEPAEIVIVPMGGDLSAGFELAGELLSQNLAVRIIGFGVTLKSAQPAWTSEAENLWLTELGAYHTRKLRETNRIYQKDIANWFDRLLGEIVAGFGTGKLFCGTVLYRFYSNCDVGGGVPVFHEIVETHGAKNYYVTGGAADSTQIEHLAAAVGGTFKGSRRAAAAGTLLTRFRVAAQGFALLVAVLLRQTFLYVQAKPSRRKLLDLQKQNRNFPEIQTWAVLQADWRQMNSLIVKSFVQPFLQREGSIGILLTGGQTLGAAFVDNRTRVRTASRSWTGLSDIESRLPECRVEQVVSAETWFEFLKLSFRYLKISGAAIFRLAAAPIYVGRKFKFDAAETLFPLLKILTYDVFQALSARLAAAKVIERHDFRGATVAFQNSGIVPDIIADVMLQRAGATTIDYNHGIPGTWVGLIPSPSSVREVQVKPDLDSGTMSGQKTVVSGKHHPAFSRETSGDGDAKPRKILIMSSYADRDLQNGNSLPLLPFQEEMLDAVTAIREIYPNRFEFRWRPHPSDWQQAIRQTAERVGDVEISKGRDLSEDLAWADVVISSFSTVLVEALRLNVPVFLHTMPTQADMPAAMCFARSRRFTRSSEIRKGFVECIEKLDAGDPEVLFPERQTHRDWFETDEEAIKANA